MTDILYTYFPILAAILWFGIEIVSDVHANINKKEEIAKEVAKYRRKHENTPKSNI